MAVNLGPFTVIRDVNWQAGGIFVAGDDLSNIFYLKQPTEKLWTNLGKLDFDKFVGDAYTGTVRASSCAQMSKQTKVFVLVGGGGTSNSIGIIMASSDGKNWSRVFQFGAGGETYTGAVIFGVVWNEAEGSFYAGGHQSDNFSDPSSEVAWRSETDILFASSDGFSWREVGRHVTRIDYSPGSGWLPWPEYKTGLLEQHCSSRVIDANGNKVPDGVYGYDKDRQVVIAPVDVPRIDYLFGLPEYPAGSASGVTVEGMDPHLYPVATGIPTTCVATSGTKWVAAGGPGGPEEPGLACVMRVDDNGNRYWDRLDPEGASMILTVCAGRP